MKKNKMTEEQMIKEKIWEDKLVIEELLWGKSGYHKIHMQKTLPAILSWTIIFLVFALIINFISDEFFPSIKSALITITALGFTQFILEDVYMVSLFFGNEGLLAWIFPALIYAFFQHFYVDIETPIVITALITIVVMRPFIDSCKSGTIQEKINELYSLGVEVTLPYKKVDYKKLPK